MAYVTDYVTKGSLSTHTFFKTIQAVLEKNSDLLDIAGTALERREAARKLVTKMVNALSAATETGGPAASAYLLGFPDHYTSHRFKAFFWFTFVKRVMLDLGPVGNSGPVVEVDTDLVAPDEILGLERTSTGVLPKSKVDDYVYRPNALGDKCLYDFLACTDVKRIPARRRGPVGPEDEGSGSDHGLRFLSGHPLSGSHAVHLRSSSDAYILNFAGGSLPRRDRGDYEQYCLTMLVFFRPGGWRTGCDVKRNGVLASVEFQNTSFAADHVRIMRNMGVLYECLDSRDDFAAARRRLGLQASLDTVSPEVDLDLVAEDQFTEDMLDSVADNDLLPLSDATSKHLAMKASMSDVLTRMHGSLPRVTVRRLDLPMGTKTCVGTFPNKDPGSWRTLVQQIKQMVIDERHGGHLSHEQQQQRALNSRNRSGINLVSVLGKSDLQRLYDRGINVSRGLQDSNLLLLHSTIETYSLNGEQQRAFCIAARHLHHREREPLRMYLGGMGGTGKSRVLLAIMGFLLFRDEAHRFIVLGPTGGSAALVGGSTYHSVLGFGFKKDGDLTTAAAEKIRD
ncbi:hypothetical protein LXA43DRAFT_897036 [Ganoderma leucocontextum]|nr:hypothetical protein LXA43DRAFT_897036 [Ganoderma leucocontextum]